jgi:hypothetical protein
VNSDSFFSIDFIVKTAAASNEAFASAKATGNNALFLLQLAYSFTIFSIGKTKLIDK